MVTEYILPIMLDRLLETLKLIGIDKATQLSEKTGLSYHTCHQLYIKRVHTISVETLEKIIRNCPAINANYVLTGDGDALVKPTSSDEKYKAALEHIEQAARNALRKD